MSENIKRHLELFCTDHSPETESLSCEGCQIFVKFMPATPEARKSGKFLVTSLKIVPRGDITEYWLTFLDSRADAISDTDIRKLVREAHRRGLHKSCQKIVSFIEYGDSDNGHDPADNHGDGAPIAHRFNFII